MSKKDKMIEITPANLKRIIMEERNLLNETLELKLKHPSDAASKTKEVGPSDYAASLAKCMNYYQACKIKEEKMIKDLKRLQEIKRELKRRIISGI